MKNTENGKLRKLSDMNVFESFIVAQETNEKVNELLDGLLEIAEEHRLKLTDLGKTVLESLLEAIELTEKELTEKVKEAEEGCESEGLSEDEVTRRKADDDKEQLLEFLKKAVERVENKEKNKRRKLSDLSDEEVTKMSQAIAESSRTFMDKIVTIADELNLNRRNLVMFTLGMTNKTANRYDFDTWEKERKDMRSNK